MRIVKYDLQAAVKTIQLCAGQDAGCEAAVHAMERIFANEDAKVMILVDGFDRENATWVEHLVLPHLYVSMSKEKWNTG